MKYFQFKLISIFVLLLAIGGCSKKVQPVKEKVGQEKLENALLWEISGNSLDRTSYLFGTIHLINENDYFLPDGTLTALDKSDKIVFEINMEEMEDMAKVMGLLSGIMMKDGVTLKDLVTLEEYQLIKDHFNEIGIPLFFFENMKPMFLTVFSSGDVKPGDLQSGTIKSYETELLNIGKKANKEFGGLESIEYQISVFDSIPYKVQADMLVESIKASDTEGDLFKEMVDIYKKQDLNAMQSMFESEEGGIEGYEDVLLINRNKNWIPIMEKMMVEKPTFFAVGAGHLGGEYGVIKLLRESGYKLKPLSHEKL